MKVTTLLGSPRKKGNTATVLGWFEEMMKGQGHKVSRVDIAELDVKACLGCHACEKVISSPGCVLKDDAVSIFDKMIDSDTIVYASPLVFWGLSSQMKTLIDRHISLVKGYLSSEHTSLLAGKNTALLVTCGGPVKNNADLVQEFFDRFNHLIKCNMVGKYVVPYINTPDAVMREGKATARRMFRDVCSLPGR
ncbi:MAG: flavodoxin family protein [Syntrophobacteraceae bacterium]